MISLLKESFKIATALAYPHYCPVCSEPLTDGLGWMCEECWNAMPPAGPGHWTANKLLHGKVFSAWHYGDTARLLIHQMKFYGRKDIAEKLGRRAGEAMLRWMKAPPVEEIVAAPLHPVRRRERGYDQNLAIARGAAEVLGLPVRTNLIVRVKHTPPQSRLSDNERLTNLTGAFEPKIPLPQNIPGVILLIDDVIHTGATVGGCIEALHRAGVADVFVLTACG